MKDGGTMMPIYVEKRRRRGVFFPKDRFDFMIPEI